MFLDNYRELMETIAKNENDAEEIQDMYEFLNERAMRMPEYIQALAEHVLGSESATVMMQTGRLETENYKNTIMTLDSDRSSKHNVMLDAMNQTNRICDKYGVSHIYPDNEDRRYRANFAAAVTMECFMTDHKQSPEEISAMYSLLRANMQ